MELSELQQGQYEMLEKLVETNGKFDQTTGPDGAHYMPADKNPFAADGMVCSNCVFWLGPSACEVVDGKLDPNAICKLWIIPEEKLTRKEESPESD